MRPFIKRRYIVLGTLGMGGLALLLGLWAWVFADLPSVHNIATGMTLPSTRVYDRHGTLLYEIGLPERGRNRAIALSDLPEFCVNAFIATEDANYWHHVGVDVVGVVRAVWLNLRGGEVVAGGSTITQQTARLLLLDPLGQSERTLQRKLKEMVLAIQLQNATSKEHVLTLYLNQAYFGNLAYGIEAASRAYFGKSAPELSLAECALLAGMVQNASLYDPFIAPDNAKKRQEVVLNLMVQHGYLSPQQAETSKRDDLQFASTPYPIRAPHAVMAVWKQLERTYGDALYTDGLEVITTIDLSWQETAERIARAQLRFLNNPPNNERVPANANNAALVAMNPHTGEVLAMLGSPDYFNARIDGAVNATLAPRQPGSTLKPFTYALAMDPTRTAPYTPATALLDVRTPFVTRKLESYTPTNYALVEHGMVSLREALASSYNIPAVVALDHVGIGAFMAFMSNIGLDSLAQNTQIDLSVTLGGGEVRLLDLVQAYSIFPSGGLRTDPVLIQRVTNAAGDVLYTYEPPSQRYRALDERVAYLITDILSDNNARQPSFGFNSPMQIGRPAAAKTGTTTDFRDNWIVGYTPSLVVGVWVGNADNTPMREVSGISGAGPIYHAFMRNVLNQTPKEAFSVPEGIISLEVCVPSGLLPTPACPLTRVERFIAGTQPTEYDNLYQTFAINRRTGALADDTTAPEDVIERTYLVLPQEAREWGLRNGLALPPEDALIRLPDAEKPLRLLSPDPYTVFELSPILPTSAQRLRFRVGYPPDTVAVTYALNGTDLTTSTTAPYQAWWELALGQYTLTATAELADGTRLTTDPLYFTVVQDDRVGSFTLGE
jgi:penicillin-binding protein 1C